MYQRFKDGLFSPAQIVKYQSDKKIITAIFFLLLVIISVIPSLITVGKNQGLNYEDRTIIRQSFVEEEIPFSIVNGILVPKSGSNITHAVEIFPSLLVVFTDQEQLDLELNEFGIYSKIVLTKEVVYFQQSLLSFKLFSYSDYNSLTNIDFAGAEIDDQTFWRTIFPIVEEQIEEYSRFTITAQVITIILGEAFVLALFGLIVAIFQMMSLSGYMKFAKVWQVMTYVMAPYVVTKVLEELFSLGYLSFLGAIITVFYANRLTQVILQRKD
ncbi:MAG: hypothetical protein PHP65_01960 [Bacilli bacterium]|nr:hypothetical protein [Bacilli bacterium]